MPLEDLTLMPSQCEVHTKQIFRLLIDQGRISHAGPLGSDGRSKALGALMTGMHGAIWKMVIAGA